MRILALLMFFLFIFLFTDDVFAISLSFDGAPGEVSEDQEFEINISLSCQSCKDSYLRAVFFKEGATSYFGYTQNERGNWINSTADKTLYYHLAADAMVDSSWSGKIRTKVDLASDNFKGPGSYLLKVGRYTGANSSATWSEKTATINILAPTPSPTPAQIFTPSPTTTSTSTPTQSSTKIPTATTKITPTQATTRKLTPSLTKEATSTAEINILGSSVSATPDASSSPVIPDDPPEDKPVRQFDNLTFVGVGSFTMGLLFIIFRRLRSLPIS